MDTPKILPTNGNGSGSWESGADHVRAGAREAIDKVTESAGPAIDKLAAGAQQAYDKIADKTSQAAAAISEKADHAMEMQEQLVSKARLRIREKPVQSLAIAVAAGFLLRHLLKSR